MSNIVVLNKKTVLRLDLCKMNIFIHESMLVSYCFGLMSFIIVFIFYKTRNKLVMKLSFLLLINFAFAGWRRSVSHGQRGMTDPGEVLRAARTYVYMKGYHRRHNQKPTWYHQRRRSFFKINRQYSRFSMCKLSIFFLQNNGIPGTKCQMYKNEHFTIHLLKMTKQTFVSVFIDEFVSLQLES